MNHSPRHKKTRKGVKFIYDTKVEYKYHRGRKGVRPPKGGKRLVSRQRVYQLRRRKEGKCINCGRKSDYGHKLCEYCRAKGSVLQWPGPLEA